MFQGASSNVARFDPVAYSWEGVAQIESGGKMGHLALAVPDSAVKKSFC